MARKNYKGYVELAAVLHGEPSDFTKLVKDYILKVPGYTITATWLRHRGELELSVAQDNWNECDEHGKYLGYYRNWKSVPNKEEIYNLVKKTIGDE